MLVQEALDQWSHPHGPNDHPVKYNWEIIGHDKFMAMKYYDVGHFQIMNPLSQYGLVP